MAENLEVFEAFNAPMLDVVLSLMYFDEDVLFLLCLLYKHTHTLTQHTHTIAQTHIHVSYTHINTYT